MPQRPKKRWRSSRFAAVLPKEPGCAAARARMAVAVEMVAVGGDRDVCPSLEDDARSAEGG